MNRLIQVVYVSDQVEPGSTESRDRMIATICETHRHHGITGFVCAMGGCYVSVLEGEHDQILGRMEQIAADDRHQRMIVLREGAIKERRFKNWSSSVMGDEVDGELQRSDAQAFASKLSKGLRMATARMI